MKATGVCLGIAVSGLLLLGCGDGDDVTDSEETATGGDEAAEPAQAEEDAPPEESDVGQQADGPAVGDEIEGTYDAGPPPDGGAATGCTWLVTDEQTFTLMHLGGNFDEDLRAEFDGYLLELDGISRIEEGQHLNAEHEQIVGLGEQLRLTVSGVHRVADFGSARDGCGDEDDILLEFDEVEPID